MVVVGVVSPAGLGDALQYCVLIRSLNKLFPEANLQFICPGLEEENSVFKNLKLNARLISIWFTRSQFLTYLLHSSIPYKRTSRVEKEATAEVQVDRLNAIPRIVRIIGRKYYNYINSSFLSSFLIRSICPLDSGIFGGHTLGYPSLSYYVDQYETLRSIVKGPMLASPISISALALEQCGQKTSILKELRQSLRKFDFVYVRGPHSLQILRDYVKIDEERVAMALDSGFGVKLIFPDITASKDLGKEALRVVIIPRGDYFYHYNKWNLYKPYLVALVNLILWLSKNIDVEVYLSSQTMGHGQMDDQTAISDVVRVLEKRGNNQMLKRLKIVKPSSVADAYMLYRSADLMITSRMHGGIMALSAGVPAVFIVPSTDLKVLDVLSFLGLDASAFLINMFDVNALRAENFINKIRNVLENLEYYANIVEYSVNRSLPTVELPVRTLAKLLR